MKDAAFQQFPKQMRALFIMIMTHTEVTDPKALFESFHQSMSEDFEHRLLPPNNSDQVLLKAMLLIDLLERLQSAGKEEKFKELGAEIIPEKILLLSRQKNCAITARNRAIMAKNLCIIAKNASISLPQRY